VTPKTNIDLRGAVTIAARPGKTFCLDGPGMIDGKEAVRQAIYLILSTERYEPHFFRCGLNLTAELFNLCDAADQIKCLDMFDFSPYIREFLSNTTQLFFWKVHTSTVLSFFSNRFHNNYLLLNSLKILPKSLHFRF